MARIIRTIVSEERYGAALLLLAVFYLLGDAGKWAARLADLAFIAILLLITLRPWVPRGLRIVSVIAASVSAMLTLTRTYEPTSLTIALDSLSTLIVLVITILAVLRGLLEHTSVQASTVMGAFLCYALIGFAAAYLYITVDAVSSEPFFAQGPQPESNFVYFSIVTLTTVGYGDLTAGPGLARRLVVIEALAGQVFLVVLVARLVSLWKPPGRISRGD